ncbi:hypothetical protein [Magnetococcus sp. PR-3]|uniref:hypothetical protein n=1 Tax=Magnetococcus sp. PR-3 TaxID=3120355 RepID=UPI002FCE4240
MSDLLTDTLAILDWHGMIEPPHSPSLARMSLAELEALESKNFTHALHGKAAQGLLRLVMHEATAAEPLSVAPPEKSAI